MLSSSNGGISHFSQVPPYLNWNPSATSSLCLNENQALLYHHEDLLSFCFNVAPIIETANKLTPVSTKKTTTASNTNTNPQFSSSSGDQCCLPILHRQCWPKKPTVKRDRHSKIFTSKGPRDRRVRLSIDISRKFFGLQDLLGFDKASLTLDWLLTKAKAAIKELLQTKQIDDANAKCLCFLSEDEDAMTGTTEEADNGGSKQTTYSKRKRKPVKQKRAKKPKMTAFDKLAKVSRAKARERARERTRVKNSLRKLGQEQKLPDLISFNPNNQSRWPWNQIGTCKPSESNRQSTMSCVNENSTPLEGFFFSNPRTCTGEVNSEEMFQDSVRIKRKTKPSSNFGFHRNLSALKDANSDFNNWPPVTNDML